MTLWLLWVGWVDELRGVWLKIVTMGCRHGNCMVSIHILIHHGTSEILPAVQKQFLNVCIRDNINMPPHLLSFVSIIYTHTSTPSVVGYPLVP